MAVTVNGECAGWAARDSHGVVFPCEFIRRYCFKIPENYPLKNAAPLLCAGISIYSPMMRHNMNQPGKSLGVIGFGALGRLVVKFGKAFGLEVTVFSTDISKSEVTLNVLGADNFVLSSDREQMAAFCSSQNFIMVTAFIKRSYNLYLSLLKPNGVLIFMGFCDVVSFYPNNLDSRSITESVIGGTEQIQEMLDFCASHQIYPDVELLPILHVNEQLHRLSKEDLNYFPVINIANSIK